MIRTHWAHRTCNGQSGTDKKIPRADVVPLLSERPTFSMPPPHDHLPPELLAGIFQRVVHSLEILPYSRYPDIRHGIYRQVDALCLVSRAWHRIIQARGWTWLTVDLSRVHDIIALSSERRFLLFFPKAAQMRGIRVCTSENFKALQHSALYHSSTWNFMRRVQEVNLWSNSAMFEGLCGSNLFRTLRTLELDCWTDDLFSPESVAFIGRCTKLHRLSISKEHWARNPNDYTCETRPLCTAIGTLKNLHTLKLWSVPFAEGCWEALTSHSGHSLREVRIGGIREYPVNAHNWLLRVPHLTHLSLWWVTRSDMDISAWNLPWPVNLTYLDTTCEFIGVDEMNKLNLIDDEKDDVEQPLQCHPLERLPAPLRTQCPRLMYARLSLPDIRSGSVHFAHPDSGRGRFRTGTRYRIEPHLLPDCRVKYYD